MMRGAESEIAAALELAGSFARHGWARYILVERAIRSHRVDGKDGLRLPIYITHRDGDPVQIRGGLTTLYKTEGIYGTPLGHGSLFSMAAASCVVKDKTASSAESLYWERQLAYQRSLPKSIAGGKRGISPTYGDTIIIVPFEFAAEAAPWGYVIEAESDGLEVGSLSRYEHNLRNWRAHAEWFLSQTLPNVRLDPAALPLSRSASGYLRHGHLSDLAFSASLEAVCGVQGFVDAVRQSWDYLSRMVSRRVTARQQDAIAVTYLKEFIRTAQAEHETGFREDSMARFIRNQDPEMFGHYSAIELGKALSRLGLGTVSRHGFYDEARRVIRAVVKFGDEDHRRMAEIERGL